MKKVKGYAKAVKGKKKATYAGAKAVTKRTKG